MTLFQQIRHSKKFAACRHNLFGIHRYFLCEARFALLSCLAAQVSLDSKSRFALTRSTAWNDVQTFISRSKLSLVSALFLVLMSPAFSMIGGVENREPDGIRKHVVTVRSNTSGHCSGIVLTKRLILTAAHCFKTAGGYYVGYLNPAFLTQRVNIEAVRMHPNYNTGANYMKAHLYDLALVQLISDLPPSMVPVVLPSHPPVLREEVKPVGFGLSDPNRTDSSLVLRELTLKVADFSKERGEINLTPTGGFMTTPGNASCKGDSGGPALRFNSLTKRQEVVGVLSWVSGPKANNSCGVKSIYTDVYSEKAWILETAKGWGIILPN